MKPDKSKLILVSIYIKESPQAVPLAAACLKAKLDSVPSVSRGLAISIHDYTVEDGADFIAQDLCGTIPDMVGFSVYLWNRQVVLEVCRILKAKFPGLKLFAGGAEATARPRVLLESAPFDFVVKGEGEIVLTGVMKRLLKSQTLDGLPGVFVKGSNRDPEKDQQPVLELDRLPSPFLTGTIDPCRYSGLLWELSRGCPFKCAFCFESRGVAGVRQISEERIRKELELFEEKKVNQIYVLDPTFNCDLKRAKRILRLILKTAPQIHFTIELRAELVDREIARLFDRVHCSLQVGLQSAHPEVLAHVNRKLDLRKFSEKVALLNESGAIFGLDLIYGLPGDTLAGFKASVNYALSLQPNHLDIFPLTVIPGTALYDRAESFRLNFLKDAPYTLISSPGFPETAMAEAERLNRSCDVFYNRGGAVGWMFMALETLDLQPADFLADFAAHLSDYRDPAAWGDPGDLTREEITRLQTAFVKKLFARHRKGKFFPVIEDIIAIHGALNRSLYAGPCPAARHKESGPVNDETVLRLSPGTIPLQLKYDFDELMAVGELNFEEFLDHYRPRKTHVVIYNCAGVVKTRLVDRTMSRLLVSLTGIDPLRKVCAKEKIKLRKEIRDFLAEAIREQMIYRV